MHPSRNLNVSEYCWHHLYIESKYLHFFFFSISIYFKSFSIPFVMCWDSSLQVATIISATATWKFAEIRKIGWTGVIWIYNILTYFLLDPLKFAVRYAISGRAWDLVVDQKVSETKAVKVLIK
jgi:hypothetical protein